MKEIISILVPNTYHSVFKSQAFLFLADLIVQAEPPQQLWKKPGKLLEMIITILALKLVLHIVSQHPILHLLLPMTAAVPFLPIQFPFSQTFRSPCPISLSLCFSIVPHFLFNFFPPLSFLPPSCFPSQSSSFKDPPKSWHEIWYELNKISEARYK